MIETVKNLVAILTNQHPKDCLIIANRVPDRKKLKEIVNEARHFTDQLDLKLDVKFTNYGYTTKEYGSQSYIPRENLIGTHDKYNYKKIIIYDPTLEDDASHGGFFHRSVSVRNERLVMSIYNALKTKTPTPGFTHRLAANIVHELGHALCFEMMIEDKTHHYWYNPVRDPQGLIDYILEKRRKNFVSRFVESITKIKEQTEDIADNEKVMVHHTASQQYNSYIPPYDPNSKGWWSWYNDLIYKGEIIHRHDEVRKRGIPEVGVVGQFDPHTERPSFQEPSKENLEALSEYLGDRKPVAHKEVDATACPGILLDRLNV